MDRQPGQQEEITKVSNYTFDAGNRPGYDASASLSKPTRWSITLQLNSSMLSEIVLILLSGKGQTLQLMASGLDINTLPVGLTYPAVLGYNQSQHYELEVIGEQAYLTLEVNVCSESSVSVGVVQKYEDLLNSKFSYQAEISSSYNLRKTLKVEQGQAFLVISTSDREGTLYSVRVTLSDTREKDSRLLAGNRGIIDYKVLDDHHI